MKSVMKIVVMFAAFVVGYLPASASAQIVLPYNQGFEGTMGASYQNFVASIPGAPEFSYGNTAPGEGRLRFGAGPGFANSGMYAATMDRDPNGADQINYLLGQLDMSNYNANTDVVVLSFAFTDHGEEAQPNDRVWIRGSSTNTFIQIVDLTAAQGANGVYITLSDINVSAILLANGQNFSTTFQIRFGQEDNFPATSTTASDGYSFDDISLTLLPPNDMGATAVVAPSSGDCGLSNTDVIVEVTNFGSAAQMNVPVQVAVSGAVMATLNATVPGPVAPGQTAQVVAGQVNVFAGGQIVLDAATQLIGDSDAANDAVQATIDTLATEIAVIPPAVGCPLDAALLSVVAEPGVNYSWWDAPLGGTELGQGAMFSTPPVTGPTSYYVERAISQFAVGPTDNTFGGGGDYGFLDTSLLFDVATAITIDTVYVYPGSAGDVTVNVLDSNNVVVASATAPVTAADVGMKTALNVNLQLPAGTNYEMNATGSTVSGLYRNNGGVAMPYASAGGEVIITSSSNGANLYYFFYDWQVTAGGCASERTAVVVDTNETACSADLSVNKTGPGTANSGGQISYTLTVTNNGPTGAYSLILADPAAAALSFVSNSGDCTTAFPCNIGYLAAGASAVVEATFTIDPGFVGTLDNTATATSSAMETAPGDESDTASVEVSSAVDLAISISANPDPVQQGSSLTYTVQVTNNGPSSATNVVVDTTLPGELAGPTTNGCATDPGGVPACALGAIAAGTSVSFTINADVNDDYVGIITATATVTSDIAEIKPGDESDSVDVTVVDKSSGVGGNGGGGGGGGVITEGGCNCRQSGGKQGAPTPALLALLGLAALGLRRRRRAA